MSDAEGPVHEAVLRRDVAAIRSQAKEGALLNAKNRAGKTPLDLAFASRQPVIIATLLALGATVGAHLGTLRWTRLHQDVWAGDIGSAQSRCASLASPNVADFFGWTPLHVAAISGRTTMVLMLLRMRADTMATDKFGWSPLHLAAWTGREAVVSSLLEKLTDVDQTSKNGMTPLHCAAAAGDVPTVLVLLKNRAGIGTKDTLGSWTPLHYAARSGHESLARVLLDAGADRNAVDSSERTPLHIAAGHGHTSVLQELLRTREKRDVHVNAADAQRLTALHNAALAGYEDAAMVLLHAGAEKDATDMWGWTPLYFAAVSGSPAVIRVLLAYKADVAVQDKELGRKPVEWALESGFDQVLDVLLDEATGQGVLRHDDWHPVHGVAWFGVSSALAAVLQEDKLPSWAPPPDLEARTASGATPAFLACLRGHTETLRVLLDAKCKIDVKDDAGFSMLHAAALSDQAEVVRQVLKCQPAASCSKDGRTPLHLAAGGGKMEAAEALLRFCDHDLVNAPNNRGQSPLHLASEFGHNDMVKLLLRYNADVHLVDNRGATALHMAALRLRHDAARALLSRQARVSARDQRNRCAFHCALLAPSAEPVDLALWQKSPRLCHKRGKMLKVLAGDAGCERSCLYMLPSSFWNMGPINGFRAVRAASGKYTASRAREEDYGGSAGGSFGISTRTVRPPALRPALADSRV